MDLKKGAVTKRWSRLKKAMENGEAPGPSVYKFLWLCVKHSSRDKVSTSRMPTQLVHVPDHDRLTAEQTMNWNDIAEQCNTTAGAASKRYSRMKQAFETGGGPPGSNPASPTPKTPSKATPGKAKATTTDGEATPTPKRKRATPKRKAVSEEEMEAKPEVEYDEDEVIGGAKKAKVVRPKATPKHNANSNVLMKKEVIVPESTNGIKNETEAEVEDFVDAQEWADSVDARKWVHDLVGGSTTTDEQGHSMCEFCKRLNFSPIPY
jgi:hypothetical protein